MRKPWLIFAQAVTIFLSIAFILAVLKPQWLPFALSSFVQQRIGNANPNCLVREPDSYALAAQRAAPAVVSIYTSKSLTKKSNSPEKLWDQYYPPNSETQQPQQGLGSGVIISAEGYILTNHHVTTAADEILVALADGRQTQAIIVGVDIETDLALLKIELQDLPVISFGNSDTTQVGDVVLVIGNPFGVGQTVTAGIVSALGRSGIGINTYENFIQTDAAINPGNSGGALINTRGELIGINTAIFSKSGGSLGIGFAIPINAAKNVVTNLLEHGYVIRGWIGVEPGWLTPELIRVMNIKNPSGILISGIFSESPAAKAGLQPGDIILQIGNQNIRSIPQLLNTVSALSPGKEVSMTIERHGEQKVISISPGLRPPVKE